MEISIKINDFLYETGIKNIKGVIIGNGFEWTFKIDGKNYKLLLKKK